jgi:hypothetical protein
MKKIIYKTGTVKLTFDSNYFYNKLLPCSFDVIEGNGKFQARRNKDRYNDRRGPLFDTLPEAIQYAERFFIRYQLKEMRERSTEPDCNFIPDLSSVMEEWYEKLNPAEQKKIHNKWAS